MIIFIEPIKGVREIADRVEIKIVNYELGAANQTLLFCLQSKFNQFVEQGNIIVPSPIIELWGVDDSVIIDWALDTLGLTKREINLSVENESQDNH